MFHRLSVLAYALTVVALVSPTTVSAAEIQLAGIKLGGSALGVVQRYGNPSEIRVGPVRQESVTAPSGLPGALPGVGSFQAPSPGSGAGVPPPPIFSGAPGSARPTAPVVTRTSAPEVTWIYGFAKNKTLEFIINPDGYVIQIAAYGAQWPSIRTSRGITLGDTYKEVILSYGYPELHQMTGIELITKYADRHRAAFTFVGNQVVGITIALMD